MKSRSKSVERGKSERVREGRGRDVGSRERKGLWRRDDLHTIEEDRMNAEPRIHSELCLSRAPSESSENMKIDSA